MLYGLGRFRQSDKKFRKRGACTHSHDIVAICLDQIYVMAFTSNLRYSDSTHRHNIEVVAMGETRTMLLPDRPGDYSTHKGDIWRLSITEDLGFSVCVRYEVNTKIPNL